MIVIYAVFFCASRHYFKYCLRWNKGFFEINLEIVRPHSLGSGRNELMRQNLVCGWDRALEWQATWKEELSKLFVRPRNLIHVVEK